MTSYVKRVGDLTDPENFEKAVAEANKNGEHVDIGKDVFVLFPTMGKTREQNEEMLSAVNERLFRDGYLPTYNVNGMVDTIAEHKLALLEIKSALMYRISRDLDSLSRCGRLYLCGEWWDDEECETVRMVARRARIEVIYER